jgi:ATP-dependent Clp protease adaptor protein ClpS
MEATEVSKESKTRLCPMYKVIMHDDPITTMEFVVDVLQRFFNKKVADASQLMLSIHFTGLAVVGIYALEHAELRVDQTHSFARARNFPLKCTIESA